VGDQQHVQNGALHSRLYFQQQLSALQLQLEHILRAVVLYGFGEQFLRRLAALGSVGIGGASQQQIGDIDASDEKHESNSPEQ